MIFPDASPERPVHLACDCGGRLELTSPPDDWPLPCPGCGEPVKIVEVETVRDMLPKSLLPETDRKLLGSPAGGGSLPARRRGGAPLTRVGGDFPADFAQSESKVEIKTRSFTGRVRYEQVDVRPPETFGAETMALALWLGCCLLIVFGYAASVDGDFTAHGMLITSLLFAAVTSAFAWIQRETVAPTLRLEPGSGFWIMVGTLGIPVTVGGVLLYLGVTDGILNRTSTSPMEDLFREDSASLPLLILAIGVLPGFFEELGFRGWMQSTWRKILAPGRALVLTACCFAVIHFSYWSIGWILPMGLYLGWLRERSGSIWPGVIAHMGHNSAIVILFSQRYVT